MNKGEINLSWHPLPNRELPGERAIFGDPNSGRVGPGGRCLWNGDITPDRLVGAGRDSRGRVEFERRGDLGVGPVIRPILPACAGAGLPSPSCGRRQRSGTCRSSVEQSSKHRKSYPRAILAKSETHPNTTRVHLFPGAPWLTTTGYPHIKRSLCTPAKVRLGLEQETDSLKAEVVVQAPCCPR